MNRIFKDAVYYYEKTASLSPNDKEIWLRLGMSYLYSDILDKAIIAFENADKLSPLNTDVHTGWGMVYMKQKKYHRKSKYSYRHLTYSSTQCVPITCFILLH